MQELLSYQRETEALAQIAGRLGWDQETVMPKGAAPQRAEEIAALEGVLHARRTSQKLADLLASATPAEGAETAMVRLITEEHQRATRIPASLAQELARVTSLAQGIWVEARAAEDVSAFLPTLSRVIELKREEGQALASDKSAYDALMHDYEPGASAQWVSDLFSRMRPRLTALRERVLAAPRPKALEGEFSADLQLRIARDLATTFGYDWTRGRLDLSVHPFSSGSGNDARITTRVNLSDPLNCFYSTIHEVGHATYEQNVDQAYLLTALGRGTSMGVHESQSRIYENQLGRSRAFTGWLYRRFKAEASGLNLASEEEFYRAINRVDPGYIRTEADEVHYNLHIMMRFDLERALIAGDLPVADLEGAWNARFAQDFGVQVDKPSNGVLQDVHWSCGLFGYFPTYTLGNVYAGCLHAALRDNDARLDESLAQGDLSSATGWLRANLQRHGALRSPQDTIAHACGHPAHEGPLLDYLEAKFTDLYEL